MSAIFFLLGMAGGAAMMFLLESGSYFEGYKDGYFDHMEDKFFRPHEDPAIVREDMGFGGEWK